MKFKTSGFLFTVLLVFSMSVFADKTQTSGGDSTASADATAISVASAGVDFSSSVSNQNTFVPTNVNTSIVAPVVNVDPRITGTNTNNVNISPDMRDTNFVNSSSGVSHSGNSFVDNSHSGNSFNNLNQHQHQQQSTDLQNIGNSSSGSSSSADLTNVGNATSQSSTSLQNVGNADASSVNSNNVQGSTQSQNSSAINKGNAQTVNNNTAKQHHNTPSMATFIPMPTAPCMATIGGSGAGAGFGFSLSGSYINENCEILETSKAFAAMGERQAALEIACSGKHGVNSTLCQGIIKERHASAAAQQKVVVMKEEVVKVAQKEVDEMKPGGFSIISWIFGDGNKSPNNVINEPQSSAKQVTTIATTSSNYSSAERDMNHPNPWW